VEGQEAGRVRSGRTDPDVGMKSLGPRATDAWVVVEYMEGDASKTMALRSSAFRVDDVLVNARERR